MFNFGFTELVVLGTIALLVIGPKQLPAVARKLAKLINELKGVVREVSKPLNDMKNEIHSEVDNFKSNMVSKEDLERRFLEMIDEKAGTPEGAVDQKLAAEYERELEEKSKPKEYKEPEYESESGMDGHGAPNEEDEERKS